MTELASEQRKLWKLLQSGSLHDLELFLRGLTCDPSALLHKVHKASGDTVMHLVCRHGFLTLAETLHRDWEIDVKSKNLDGKTPLHESASNGHAHVVKFLLEKSVDVDCLKRNDWTPLMMACTKYGNLDTVKLLINHQARINLVNKDGWDCFHIACRLGDLDIVRYIFCCDNNVIKTVSKNGRTPIHTAALHGKFKVLEFLLDVGHLSLEAQDSCGSTPLMEAVKGGHITLVKYILNHDVDLNTVDNLGRTVLHVAAECDQDAIIEYLIVNCGIDPNTKTQPRNGCSGGHSALDWAYKEQQTKAISTLTYLGADDG